MKLTNKIFLSAIFTLALIGALCVTGCKATLAPGGSYAPVDAAGNPTQAPDVAFYGVDKSFEVAHRTLDAIFKIEYENRDLLWKISPAIKHGLDAIRPAASKAVEDYSAARVVYQANPSPANLDGAKQVLNKLQQLLTTAETILATKGVQ